MRTLEELKGIGKARLETMRAAGIRTLADLLLTLPVRYQDTSTVTPLSQAAPGMEICVSGYPKAAPRLSRFHGLTSVTLRLCDETGSLPIVWFNQPIGFAFGIVITWIYYFRGKWAKGIE